LRLGDAPDESLGASGVGGLEDMATLLPDNGRLSIVDRRGIHVADPTVVVLVVVPVEEVAREATGVLQAAEAIWKLRSVFQGLELGFREGVVVGDVWPRVGFADSQVRQEQRQGSGLHGRAAISVDGELPREDALLLTGLLQQPGRQRIAFPFCDHPAHDVTAEDVEDHVELKVGPLDWAQELGDIPGPNLVGALRQELGLGVDGMAELVAALSDLAMRGEDPVHGAGGTEVAPCVQEEGVDLGGGFVHEGLGMEDIPDFLLLGGSQCAG